MVEYHIERLNDKNAAKWDEFNNNSEEGSFFHSLKWKHIIDKNSDFKSHYFLLFKNNRVFGIFPFVEENIRFFRGLVPTYNLCPIIQDYSDPSVIQYVITELQKCNRHPKKISYILFLTSHKEIIDNIKNYPGFPNEEAGNMILNLSECPPEKIWNNFSAKKGQRKFIRRFDENGYRVTEINSDDDLKLFYQYYEENIKFIGGKLQTFSYFTDLWNDFSSDEMRITLLSNNSIIAGGLLMFPYKPLKIVYLEYLSLNRNLPNTYHPTYYLWWEAINWAWSNNYEKISLGLTQSNKNSPRYRIKSEFGAKFKPVYSKTISLDKLFTLGYRCYKYFDR